MEHFYDSIEGWFDFHDIYLEQIQRVPNDGAIFVEVGCYLGRSTVFMATEIINSGKNITFITIDSFQGVDHPKMSDYFDIELYRAFHKNIIPVKDVIIPIVGFSDTTSKLFADKSIDFVFIDANHEYEYVSRDMRAWIPKIKTDGYIGGHDYDGKHLGINKALEEVFKNNFTRKWCSWLCAPSQMPISY